MVAVLHYLLVLIHLVVPSNHIPHMCIALYGADACGFLCWTRLLCVGCGDCRKGAKQWNEDSYLSFASATGKCIVGAVFDGHGGYNGIIAQHPYCGDV